jgi:hypothetical protein
MIRQHSGSSGGKRSQRPAELRKHAAVAFALVCIVGPAMAWDWDAAPVRIVAPSGFNIDSGTVVTPSAVVMNLGDSMASFPVLFSITPDYLDTADVVDLGPGDSITLTFTDWTALQRGAATAACSTALSVDESTANDRISRDFNVRVRDVSADDIVAPVGIINFGLDVTPQAQVTNHGTGSANFWAVFRIGEFYVDTAFVFGLSAGASQVVDFADWTADTLGTFAVACTLMLNGDSVPGNDLAQDSCTVQVVPEDAGVMRVVAPRGLVDSGAVFTPQAMVRNFGSDAISFPVIFTVGTYADTQQVTDLASLDSLLVIFDDWTAEPVGMLTTRCSTALTDDPLPGNDEASDSVNVIVRTNDAGVMRIDVPADTVDSGDVFAPQALVRNFGLATISFPVRMRIGFGGGAYTDTQQVTDLAAGDSVSVSFVDYTVNGRGITTARCNTILEDDQDPANDLVMKNVFRRVRDAGAASILAPTGVVPPDTVVIPAATIRNFGNTVDSFPVIFRIGKFYEDTVLTNDSMATFRPCTLSVSGTFSVMCSTAMVGDVDTTNDAVFDSVVVAAPGIGASDDPGLPRTVTLNGTGPAAGRVAIQYGLPRSAVMRLEVYDACGRRVRTLASGIGAAGYHTETWNCTDEHGRAVAEGAYFVRLTADDVTLTSKVVKTE